MFTNNDLHMLEEMQLSVDQIDLQLNYFKKGFPFRFRAESLTYFSPMQSEATRWVNGYFPQITP